MNTPSQKPNPPKPGPTKPSPTKPSVIPIAFFCLVLGMCGTSRGLGTFSQDAVEAPRPPEDATSVEVAVAHYTFLLAMEPWHRTLAFADAAAAIMLLWAAFAMVRGRKMARWWTTQALLLAIAVTLIDAAAQLYLVDRDAGELRRIAATGMSPEEGAGPAPDPLMTLRWLIGLGSLLEVGVLTYLLVKARAILPRATAQASP